MDQKIKDRWVEALRSGEYEQGRGALKSGDRFCCLGVLCDLFVKDGLGTWGQDLFGSNGYLPPVVVAWAGLRNKSPAVDSLTLTCLNDTFKTNFTQIADLIEAHL